MRVKELSLLLSLLFVAVIVAADLEEIEVNIGMDALTDDELSFLGHRSVRSTNRGRGRGSNRNRGQGRPSERPSRGNAKKNLKDMEAEEFLSQFGYVRKMPPGVSMDEGTRREAIRKFQRMTGIPASGRLDNRTRLQMKKPRCGMPDSIPESVILPPSGVAMDAAGQPVSYYAPGYKWNRTSLTYKINDFTSDMPEGSVRRAIFYAFKYWSDVTPLEFNEVSGTADLNIRFRYGQHEDGPGNAFDGPDGVLAHAFYPMDGEIHYDEGELWTEYTEEGYNLQIVAAHEIGHALGLGHSNVYGALMAPYYAGYVDDFQLHEDDIRGIQTLYGPRRTAPTTSAPATTRAPSRTRRPATTRRQAPARTTPVPAPTQRPGSGPDPCTTKFDAMFQGPDYKIYVFRGQYVFRLNYWGLDEDYPKLSREVFESPPINIGAAVYSWKSRYTYFFKGNKIWQYYNFEKVKRKIVTNPNFPLGVQAAFMNKKGEILLLKGSEFWKFDEESMDTTTAEGTPFGNAFGTTPRNIEAAVRLVDGFVYFIKGRKYRKFDEYSNKVLESYPKFKAHAWMGQACGEGYIQK